MPEPEAKDKAPEAAETSGDGATATEGENSTAIPAGVVPLFFSGAGQKIFECVVDQDVTPEAPNKLISKQKILDDFMNRRAVSDFHPVKKKIQDYDGEELLLVYDHDFKFGENFYICITQEAKELILNPPEEEKVEGGEEQEEEEDEIPKTPIPQKWESLGSDLEIKEAHFKDKRALLKYSVSRKRRHFEYPRTFTSCLSSAHPDNCIDVSSQEQPSSDVHKMEMETGVQAIMEKVECSSQTEWLEPCNKAVQYSPRTFTESEAQNFMNDSSMEGFLSNVIPRLEVCLQQNSILNMFEDDYKLLSDMDGITGRKSDTTLKEYQSFTDLQFSKNKVITHIEWHPTIKGIIAVSCGESIPFDDRVDLSNLITKKQFLVLLWSFTDPIHPILFLEAPDNVLCFKFNPTNPNLIVGGCTNGQILLWNIEEYQDHLQINKNMEPLDTRSTAASKAIFDTDPKLDHAPMVRYCVTTSIKEGHSREVGDVQWVPHSIEICHKTGSVLENPSRQCSQVISCSLDGTLLVWDIRQPVQKTTSQQSTVARDQKNTYGFLDLTWKPFIRVPMPRGDIPGKYSATKFSIKEKQSEAGKETEGGAVLSIEVAGVGAGPPIEGASTMFFVGTEDGEVVYCDWKPTKDSESGKFIVPLPSYRFNTHVGPVHSLVRSPFFRDIVLTVGGYTWSLWKEGAESGCLLSSSCSSEQLTGGAWSPTRPGVFFVTKRNGNVDVWDLMDRSHEGLLTQNISSLALTSVFPWQLTSKQMMLAVGDSGGTLHILEIPWNLSHPASNELTIMENFFLRQVQRLDFTTKRMEKRAAEKTELDTLKLAPPKSEEAKGSENWEEKAKKDYDSYLSLELKLLISLGARSETNPDDAES